MMLRILRSISIANVIACSACLLSVPGAALALDVAVQRPKFANDEVIVKFKDGISSYRQQSMVSAQGFTPMATSRGIRNIAQVKLDKSTSVAQAVARFQSMPEVEFVQPNYYYYPTAVPMDPDYMNNQLWGLNNTGTVINNATYNFNNPGTIGADMSMEPAWDILANGDCSSVVVAVVDSGVNYQHQDLAANMWTNAGEVGGTGGVDDDGNGFTDDIYGWDSVDNDPDPMPADAFGHGTHVAGTIGAVGDNNVGGTGVCWQVQLMSLRALSSSGGSSITVAAAINYAANNGADVINLSLGGPSPDNLVAAAMANARANDVVVVAAAGNSGTNNDQIPVSPCNENLDNIVCVAALDQSYNRASFSNYGAFSVDVGAPGTNVLSTWPGTTFTENFGDWTLVGGGWAGVGACNRITGTPAALVNPNDFCVNNIAEYANNANNKAYKIFDLSQGGTAVAAGLDYFLFYSIVAGDALRVGYDFGAGADPFDNTNDTILGTFSGATGNAFVSHSFALGGCLTANCGIGFQLQSDAANTGPGTAIASLTINTAETNSTATAIQNGTSMATPHVAGLAAMIRAYNPNYTYVEVIESIKNGGTAVSSLSGISTTGRAVDAEGSLRYLSKPKGLSASVTIN